MTSGREITPPTGSTAIPIPTTMFTATTPENTPIAYRASTSANPNPVISLAFVEANYEALESLLRDWHRQMHNNDLRTKLEYFGKDYDEERGMEPRPEPTRAATPPLRVASPRINRRGERTVAHLGRGENGQPLQSSLTSAYGGQALPNNIGGYLPSNAIKLPHVNFPRKTPYGGNSCPSPTGGTRTTDLHKLTRSLVEHLSTDLPSTYKGLMEKTYTWVEAREDHGHETNQCRELKHQIEEAVKSGQLTHLVKGVKEKKEKTTGTLSEERKNEGKKLTLDQVSVLMISGKKRNLKKRHANHDGMGEITFPPLLNVGSSDPVIIKMYISGRQVNRAYLDGGSSCEVIYEHCFLKLKPSIRSLRVDSNTPLIGFSGEQSWPLGEIPLEVTIGEVPIVVTKTLTFVIIKSNSPHNLLLGRTVMQQMGIVDSTVHGAIKFHTPKEPVKQKKRSLAPERNEVIHSQVEELTKAVILRGVKYQTWVSSPMVVKKDNGKWKLHMLNHIPIAEKDEEKALFFTREGLFCYKRLPFGLKNAGDTYQKLIDKVFGHQMGRNMEVNADDMVIKRDSEKEMMADITETLKRLRAIKQKPNPKNAPTE
ncbi:reverse transcriptase domain-containing protein [Tanacetum coccineum]|uniref:Reverse transcriptase domain-containing protein n=1 Tax=Tanacetum coccineum TaxID=301880 RepID=A0ABQ5BEJ0_9ASTR